MGTGRGRLVYDRCGVHDDGLMSYGSCTVYVSMGISRLFP